MLKKFAAITMKKQIINNCEYIVFGNIVTYRLKDTIQIADGSMVVSINGNTKTIRDKIK